MRFNKLPLLLVTGWLFCFHAMVLAESTKATHPFVVTGVIKNSNSAMLLEKFSQYLSKHADYPLNVIYAANYTDLTHIMRQDPKAIGWTCGAPYVQDQQSDKQQLVAVPAFNPQATYYSVVLTRSNRKEKTLADFKNAVLAYSDPRSNSGFLAPKYALFKQSIDMKKHFRLLLNAGNHEGSIEALLSGLADVAAVDEYIWLAYLKDYPQANHKLREIERMGPYPFTPIVASRGVSQQQVNKLMHALTNMHNDLQGKQILQQFNLDKFVNKNPDFYNPIRDMLNEVEIKTGN